MKAKDLKNSILQMAVEGKLVPQDPNDEPASVLLERIREEKQRLIAEGKAKFPKGGESIIYIGSDGSPYEKRMDTKGRVLSEKCIAGAMPFEELPEGWAWARLETLALILNGDRGKNYPAKSKLHKSGIPFVSAINIERGVVTESNMLYLNESQYEALRAGQLQKGDSVFCIRGSLGKHGVFPFDKGAIASSLVVVRLISSEVLHETYLELLFDSPLTFIGIRRFNNGTAQPNLAARDFGSFLYALPPLTEQRRIVERVEELMPLVEEYGELEDAREELDAALSGRLRKSVLQMAVQGKLAPQDPADEPASVLLERIRGQRRKLVADGKAKFPKGGESVIFRGSDGRRYEKRIDAKGGESEPVCIEDEIPFGIPETWAWARIGTLFEMGAGKNIKASEISEQPTEDRPFCCYGGNGIRGYVAFFNQEGDHPIIGRQGALCGNVQRATGRFYATEHAVVTKCLVDLDVSWACLFMTALNLNQYATATAQPGLAVSKIVELLIPLPPLAEQHRIVERIERLASLTA